MVDLTGASSEDDREAASFSPFLAKKPKMVMQIGSTSSDDVIMETQDNSVQEMKPEVEKVVESEKEKVERELLDDSVIIEEAGKGDVEENC